MSSSDAIGGYFELELPPERPWLRSAGLKLNSGRACLEYLLQALGVHRLWLPKFTCDVVLEPVDRLACPRSFYRIDDSLRIVDPPRLGAGEYLLYTNYFGCMDRYCEALAGEYGHRLILDLSQALFFPPPPGVHSFYSPRKFVGAPDGGCLFTDASGKEVSEADVSVDRYRHLVGRIDLGAEAAYSDFRREDASLSGIGLKRMSASTARLLASIDYERIREMRERNFRRLDARLGDLNRLSPFSDRTHAAMVYPFVSEDPGLRARLIEARIFVATYWPNVFDWCGEREVEHVLARTILPLPIDQRYGDAEMDRIAELVLAA